MYDSDEVLINADLSQAELRVMAILSGDEWMIKALQEGEGDFFSYHMLPASYKTLFPNGVEDVLAYEKSHPREFKEARTNVKGVQYGLAFGRQAVAIGKALKISTREANSIITDYLNTASGFAQWRQDVMEAAIDYTKRDLLISPFGRKFHSELVTPHNYANVQREALSFLPQSTSSDICLTTAILLDSELEDAGYRIFNVVHDAIMIRGPRKYADEIGTYVGVKFREVGEIVMGDSVPFLSEYSIGTSWADLD